MKKKNYIVRTYSAGVFAGEIVKREGKEVEIEAGGDSEISLTEIVRRIPAGTAGRSDNVLNRIVSEYICRIFGKEGIRKRHGGGEKTRVYSGLRFVE